MTSVADATPAVVVVGGGLSGLVAAHQVRQDLPGAGITVVEATSVPGGKLDTDVFASGPVELGAEAFIGRRPEAADLVAELGLTAELRHPSALTPAILTGGRPHPMPAGTVMGLPSDARLLAGVLSPDEVDRAAAEERLPLHWERGSDVGVGELVAERFGPAVVARLVDPMLGGVYAATSAGLGLREVVPGLAEILDSGATSLTAAVREVLSRRVSGPVFATFAGGYRRLVDTLVERSSADVRTNHRCRGLRATTSGTVEVTVDGPEGTWAVHADAVVLAVPVPDAVALLAPVAPSVADSLSVIRTASSAVVAMEVDRTLDLPEYSGVLVATDEPVPFKAMTFSSRKWPHLDDRPGHLVRVSFGRLGADQVLEEDDAALTRLAVDGLAGVCGGEPRVLESRVRRWIDVLPEIGPGHSVRVASLWEELRETLPGVELVGAATEGVGVPACIGSARAAARRLAERWQD